MARNRGCGSRRVLFFVCDEINLSWDIDVVKDCMHCRQFYLTSKDQRLVSENKSEVFVALLDSVFLSFSCVFLVCRIMIVTLQKGPLMPLFGLSLQTMHIDKEIGRARTRRMCIPTGGLAASRGGTGRSRRFVLTRPLPTRTCRQRFEPRCHAEGVVQVG